MCNILVSEDRSFTVRFNSIITLPLFKKQTKKQTNILLAYGVSYEMVH